MFRINYEFQDGGPLYKCTYPQKEDSDNNIFFIRGTNDQGKTTTLNMVALGLYADKSFSTDKGIISDSLRAKMDYLSSGDLDILKFDFEIKSRDGQTYIHSQYDNNNNLQTELNGEPVGSEYLNENIQVLYDVPDDPLVKLQSSVRLIKENFMDYEKYFDRYRTDLESKITHIMDFKKKDERIQKVRADLENTQRDLNIKKELSGTVENEFLRLETADKVLSYFEIIDSFEQNEEQLKIKTDKKRGLKQKGIGGGTHTFKNQITEFNSVNSAIKSALSEIIKYFESLSKEQLAFFKKIRKKLIGLYSPMDITIEEVDKWGVSTKEIVSQLENDPIINQFQEEERQFEFVKKMLEVLRDYLSLEMNIPGTNEKGIFSFYKELKQFNKQIEPKISRKQNLSKVIKEINKLTVHLSDLKVKRDQIPEVDEEQMFEYKQIEKEIKELKVKQQDLVQQTLMYQEVIDSLSKDENEEIRKNPGQREQYQRKKKQFNELKKDIAGLEQKEKTFIAIIKELGVMEEPPAYDLDWLQEEYDKCNALMSKITTWRQPLEQMDFGKTDLGIKYDQGKQFFDTLSEYFAEILQNVYFETKSWKVEKVDIVNKQYIVKSRNPIKFIQMGTGHTALNSILSRIKQNFGGKKKIILVDEIGHMDEKNIGILVDEIKSQIEKGEALFALITIADNTVSKITWEPIPM